MKKLVTFFCIILMVIASDFLTAWGFQVFWNHLVLNIWQLFTEVDVINTMQISYWVFFAIAISISLVYSPTATEETDDICEAFGIFLSKALTKVVTICLTLIVTSLVF